MEGTRALEHDRQDKVLPSSPTAPAGKVTLSVSNIGPTTHEFVVVRTDLPDGELPIGADG